MIKELKPTVHQEVIENNQHLQGEELLSLLLQIGFE